MTNSKTTALKLSIKTGDPRPIFKQVVDGIGMAIAVGELAEGDKLPSVRALAMRLSINPNTVAKAYNELTSMGLVDSRQGLGLFVSVPKQLLSNNERKKRLQQAIERCLGDVMHLNYSDEEILKAFREELEGLRKVPKVG
ncbi:MAG: GntR family transcriptional regulator [Pseudomonadales bacterium]|nr:GntR family transcriptional regulator [Pseudomonadales bacterium]